MNWKDGASFALCLTHDVDRIQKKWYHYGFYTIKKGIYPQICTLREKLKGNEPYYNFDKIIKIEKEFGASSTFLFLNEKVRKLDPKFMGRYQIKDKKILEAIELIKANGCEIGFHGSFYSYQNEEMLKEEKLYLDHLCGRKVVSTRQHHLNFSESITWKTQKNAGLLFDSTKGFNDHVGLELPIMPYVTEEGILEFPMTLMDTINFKDEHNISIIWEVMDSISKAGGVMTLNFHQCKFDLYDHPEIMELYPKILEKATEKNAWIAPMGEIGNWLIQHEI